MNLEAQRIFGALQSEVTDLHVRWLIYRQLYAASDEAIDLLNRSGSNVFYLLQFMALDDVALRLSKLTDPPSRGKFENLSMGQLAKALSADAADFGESELTPLIDRLATACAKFRELRNKRVAHRDLTHALRLEKDALPGHSREDIETALAILREAMDAVELHFTQSQTEYEDVIVPYSSDGNRLLKVLRKGLAAEDKEREERKSLGADSET